MNGIFRKVKNFAFVALKCYLHSVPNKKKPLYVFLLCVKYKIQNCTTDAISLGEKMVSEENGLKGYKLFFRL